jgi:hypothetical protein
MEFSKEVKKALMINNIKFATLATIIAIGSYVIGTALR